MSIDIAFTFLCAGLPIALLFGLLVLGAVLVFSKKRFGYPLCIVGALGLAALLGPVFLYAYESGSRSLATNNFRAINVAMHDYAAEHGSLPPAAVYSNDGRPLLSWRVLILPYLEHRGVAEPGLFQQFKLDEAWDSAHNYVRLDRMPNVFRHPCQSGVGLHFTCCRAFVGKGTAFEGQRGIALADLLSGPESIILVAESSTAVPWTKPDEMAYEADKPVPSLGGRLRHVSVAAFADGRVVLLGEGINEASLRTMIARSK